MALPPPQSSRGLPIAQSTPGLPVSDLAQVPDFGVYPSEQALVGMGTPGMSINESVAGFAGSALGRLMEQRQLELLRQQGLPLDSNPNEWTPEEAAAQTDAAIAKIATVNPDLAEQLLEQREGQQDNDDSFFDNLKELAGDIVAPVLNLGGKALELLSRPARIVPELLSDRDDDPWYEDIGQALSGNSEATWSRVLDDWGVDNGLVRAIGGFALDVASDPLTYLTFGMAGVGRGIAARTASATVGKAVGREMLEKAVREGTLDLGTRSLDDVAERLYTNLLTPRRFRPGGALLDPDAAAARAGITLQAGERQAAQAALEASDKVHRMVTTVGLANMPQELALSAGRKLTKDEVYGILKAGMNQFDRRGIRGASWLQTKALAGAQGGMRFRFAVPFTDLRYISPAVPGTAKMNFQIARRFVTGTSGMNKLVHAIDAGQASWDDFARWVDGGYKEFAKSNPTLWANIRGRGGSFGSKFYSMSESLGGLTSSFAPHAQVLRGGGIMGQMASDWNVAARGWEEDLINHGWSHTRTDGEKVITRNREEMVVALGKALSPDAERQGLYREYLEALPSREVADGDVAAFLREHGAVPTDVEELGPQAVDAWVTERAERIGGIAAQLSDEEKDALWSLREMQDGMRDIADREGANILDTTIDLDGAASLGEADSLRWNRHSRADTREVEFVVDSGDGVGVDVNRRNWQGFNVQDQYATGGLGYGVRAVNRAAGSALEGAAEEGAEAAGDVLVGTAARVRLRKAATVGTTPAGTPSDQALLDELYAEAREVAEKELGQAKAKAGALPEQVGKPRTKAERMASQLDIPEVEARADQLVTEALKKRGYDGIVEYGEDGTVASATVFDATNVKRVNPDAPNVVANRGYVPRVMTEEAQQFLDGKLDPEVERYIYGSPKMHHDVSRKFADLPVDDAEREVREVLRRQGYDVPADMPIFERDMLRIHDKYVHRLTTHVMHESAGFNAGRMAYLSELAPGLMGGVAGHTTYSWKVSEQPLDVLERMPGRVRHAVERTEKANRKAIAAQYRAASAAQDSLLRVRAALEGQPGLTGRAGRVSAGQRRVAASAARDAGAVKRDLDTAMGQWRDVLRRQKRGLIDAETFKSLQADLSTKMKELRAEAADVRKGTPTRRTQAAGKAADRGGELFEQEARLAAAEQRRVDRAMRHLQDAINEQNRLVAAYKIDAAKPAAALVPAKTGKRGFVQLQVNGMEDLAMPAYIAHEFHSLLEKGRGLQGIHKTYRKVLGSWKAWATIRWPGFHLRNNQGAIFNNLLGGVDEVDYDLARKLRMAYNGKGSTAVVPPKVFNRYRLGTLFAGREKDLTWGEWADSIADMGIGTTGHGRIDDVRTTAEAIEKAIKLSGKKAGARRALAWYDRKVANPATELTENFHRTAAYLGGLRQTAGDPYGARAFTMMRHGDYADLTPFERDFVKDVIPFYKWLRTNLPYQFHQLMENPAQLLAADKASQAAISQLSDEERAAMPDWQKEAFNIPLPEWAKKLTGAELMTLDLPNSDLHQGSREFFSSFLPLVRPAAESFLLEKSMFTGKPIEGEMQESVIGSIPVVGEVLETLGIGRRNTEGKLMVPDKVDNLLTTIPAYSRFRHFLWSDPDRVEKRANTLFSVMLGVGLNQLDDESLTKSELSFFYDEVEPLMDMYRQLGVQFPSKDDLDPGLFAALGFETPESEAA